jgi:hypothetical protein
MKKVLLVLIFAMVVAAAPAYADVTAYGVAWDNIYNGFFNIVPVNTASSAAITGAATDSTAASSTLNGTAGTPGIAGAVSGAVGTGPIGPVINQIGTPTVTTAGNMSQVGVTSTDYAVGQAQIVQIQTGITFSAGIPGNNIVAINKAEANVVAPPSNQATANGNNASSSNLTVTIVTGGLGATVNFSGQAAPYMQSILAGTGPFLAPSKADSSITASLTITNSQGQTVFSWAPNGAGTTVSGTIGGTDLFDPFSLNTDYTQLGAAGTKIYDPTGAGASLIGNRTPGATLPNANFFEVMSNTLPAGTYTLSLAMNENESVIANVATVPEPGTILLVGAGLLGLAAISRRKRS